MSNVAKLQQMCENPNETGKKKKKKHARGWTRYMSDYVFKQVYKVSGENHLTPRRDSNGIRYQLETRLVLSAIFFPRKKD